MEKYALPGFTGDFSLGFYRIEVQAPEVEEQIHLEPMPVAEAPGFGDDELDEAVQTFRAGVVVEVATVSHDAVQMGPDHSRHAAHGIEAAPQRPGDPLRQE